MKLIRLAAAAALLALTACSSITGDAAAVSTRKAAQVALTAYADLYQPAVLAYGRLPVCPAAPVCRDQAVLRQLQGVDAKATAAITAARPILNGSAIDDGQLGVALLAIQQAQTAILGSGALKLR